MTILMMGNSAQGHPRHLDAGGSAIGSAACIIPGGR